MDYVKNNPLTLIDPSGFFWDTSGLTEEQKKRFQDSLANSLKSDNATKEFKASVKLIESSKDVGVKVSFVSKANAAQTSTSDTSRVDSAAPQTGSKPEINTGSNPNWSGFDKRSSGYAMPPPEGAAVVENVIAVGNPSAKSSSNSTTLNFNNVSIGLKRNKSQTFVMNDKLDDAELRKHERGHEIINKQVTEKQTEAVQKGQVENE